MTTKNYVVKVQHKKPISILRQATAGAVATVVASSAFADAQITSIAANATAEMTAAQTAVVSLFGVGIVILALFAGYRYLKRGTNSA